MAAALAAPLTLGTLAVPAFADHTAVPGVVALVGSLQSEIGCPGDWQPECAASRLLPVEGSPTLFRATFEVPAGTYAMKVALDNSWDENYGAGGAAGGSDVVLTAPGGPVTFTYDHTSHVLSDDVPDSLGAQAGAHWLTENTIAWQAPAADGTTYRLYSAPDGGLALADGGVTGGAFVPLERADGGLDPALTASHPHLAGFDALRLPESSVAGARDLLKGQLLVAAVDADGQVTATTGVQIPGILDALYPEAAGRELGLRWKGKRPELSLWAPTARSVTVHTYAAGSGGEPAASRAMEPSADGVWSVTGDKGWKGAYYLYEVEVFVPETGKVERNLVTDPYSVGLSANSARSLFVDLKDKDLMPAGWRQLQKPELSKPEDLSIYELHVRDFSITDDSVPELHRGTYKAFTDVESNGMRRLRELTAAGMNAVHLLPVNDIGTIEERRSQQLEPACDLASMPADSEEQQACVAETAGSDGFNWGYDPLHYTTPEGSYSTDPDGSTRITEFREMVAALNNAGARVIQDVVYNHTASAGQSGSNNLDRIVPGYYHRLNPATGSIETSSCCANTATENAMMGKLMIDSVVTLARTYKLDGFRFDLMGHHSKQNMLDVRAALDGLTLDEDGVDGRNISLYGEGWNFGEVANNARFVQATQLNMAGTGIATFNDRLRDAVRGGGPFDPDPRVQGFASGLFTDPNESPANGTPEQQKAALLLAQDLVKVGLTGNLKDYSFIDRTGATVTGADVPYNGAPAGYTSDPQEAVTYVEAHDNETLFDALALKLPQGTPMAERTRMQTLALGTTAFSQGISFWHAGGESLRSKSLDRNSYDSGDWFNILDHTDATNGFGRGLPPKPDNQDKYQYLRPLLADPALKPAPAEIGKARARAAELLQIRKGTPLFRLGEAGLVQQKVSFPSGGPDQAPGVVVMRIDDTVGPDVDPSLSGLVVVFNASDEAISETVAATAGSTFALHPVQAAGVDTVVKAAAHDAASGTFTVPARTVAVFQSK
ncbi:pullulanase-type alpha-1,6-glucosidase [Pseudarthrobacter sp. J75]|uniref:pullulanase-type alpha-1,6-glucosidase n=1 Tax=Pseudarthrobacter sp. J47 TaxID=3116482 RepID=UPI002E808527|nr:MULTISPECIES: pullulanase-type alpha-1,6-glucosidase [unclassified Pseudarthrobacter]MEE2522381.1 pullulanase-type alpha-1,6-glucosidase [Pseudarthrobacter sp. J47]MEE2527973.1 pullulanase-type alpha-1,6-glucosidase [Pseudarthrobacter sp. J75]